jgi:hypothetical protein
LNFNWWFYAKQVSLAAENEFWNGLAASKQQLQPYQQEHLKPS